MIQCQILQTNIIRTTQQTVRRITNEILGVKGLRNDVSLLLSLNIYCYVLSRSLFTSNQVLFTLNISRLFHIISQHVPSDHGPPWSMGSLFLIFICQTDLDLMSQKRFSVNYLRIISCTLLRREVISCQESTSIGGKKNRRRRNRLVLLILSSRNNLQA